MDVLTGQQMLEMVPEAWRYPQLLSRLQRLRRDVIFADRVAPLTENIFRAFKYFGPSETKIVIIGQDPYYQPCKANGLAFGVDPRFAGRPMDGSLGNIAKAVEQQTGTVIKDTTLESWARQGVLLLNSFLTVGRRPLSHSEFGWQAITDGFLKLTLQQAKPIVFLWGKEAYAHWLRCHDQGCPTFQCSHPSTLSADLSFFKCTQFRDTKHIIKWGGAK